MNQHEQHKELLVAINQLTIAVGSLNPDPAKTISDHRREQKRAMILSLYAATTSTIAIILTVCDFIF